MYVVPVTRKGSTKNYNLDPWQKTEKELQKGNSQKWTGLQMAHCDLFRSIFFFIFCLCERLLGRRDIPRLFSLLDFPSFCIPARIETSLCASVALDLGQTSPCSLKSPKPSTQIWGKPGEWRGNPWALKTSDKVKHCLGIFVQSVSSATWRPRGMFTSDPLPGSFFKWQPGSSRCNEVWKTWDRRCCILYTNDEIHNE